MLSPGWGPGDIIKCPVCGFECCHIQAVAVHQGRRTDLITREESLRTVHDNLNPGARGSSVVVGMFCESGHSFDVVMSFHKGSVSLMCTVTDTVEVNHDEELWRD